MVKEPSYITNKEKKGLSIPQKTELYYKDKGKAMQQFYLEDRANENTQENVAFGGMGDGNIWYFWENHIHRYNSNGDLLFKLTINNEAQKINRSNYSVDFYKGNNSIYGKDGTL